MPTIPGLSAGLQASTVAQRWRETTALGAGIFFAAGLVAAVASAPRVDPARARGMAASDNTRERRGTPETIATGSVEAARSIRVAPTGRMV